MRPHRSFSLDSTAAKLRVEDPLPVRRL
jgi:hypothetical protein